VRGVIGQGRLQFERNAALAALDRVPVGVIVVDASGLMIAANHMARQILEAADPLSLRENRLVCEGPDKLALDAAIARALANHCGPGEPGEEVVALGRPHRRPVPVLVFPLDVRERFDEKAKRTAVLFVRDPERYPIRTESRWLETLFAVTPTEARLAACLSDGLSLEAAAEALGMSTATARVHLKRVFSKTGTSRQAELVRLVLSGPALAPLG
jgi:DNA-binding CsgD family transcriptional regulator